LNRQTKCQSCNGINIAGNKEMKIATYNVNGVNGRLPVLLRWLKGSSPDVACLQELKTTDDKFPLAAISDAGYKAIWHGQKSWNGVAVLAKDTLELQEMGRGLPGDPNDEQSRYIETNVNGILICCLYLPNGNPAPGPKFDYKLSWLKRLNAKAKKLVELKKPVILLGDFNVVPTEQDAYKPERWVRDAVFFPESRAAYAKLLKQGWTDSIRKLYPDEKIFTYWDYFRNAFARDAGIRMDHILLNPVLKKRLVAGGVDKHVRGWEKTSDHAPVWIELKDKL
jgi:exodeoxyribonuclease III